MKKKHLQWISYTLLAAGLSLSALSAAEDIEETKEEAPESQINEEIAGDLGAQTFDSISELIAFREAAALRDLHQNLILSVKILFGNTNRLEPENPSEELYPLYGQLLRLMDEADRHLQDGTYTQEEFRNIWNLAQEINALECREWAAEQEAQRQAQQEEEANTQLTETLQLRDNTGLSPCTLATIGAGIAAAIAAVTYGAM